VGEEQHKQQRVRRRFTNEFNVTRFSRSAAVARPPAAYDVWVMEVLTSLELAGAAGSTLERVERYTRLGIIHALADARFRLGDVRRVRFMDALEASGITAEQVSKLAEAGTFSLRWIEDMFPDPTPLSSLTYEQVAAELQMPPAVIELVYRVSALPRPRVADPVRQDDLEMLRRIAVVFFALGRDEQALAASIRYFGENLRRLAESQVRFFWEHVQEPLLGAGRTREAAETVGQLASQFVEIGLEGLNWLYRRHLEHYVIQDVIVSTEAALEEAGLAAAREQRPPTIAFLDLSGYTALTEEQGDQAAVELADRLSTLVQETPEHYGGRAVKLLGDGVMFHFPDATKAVLCGLELVERVPSARLPRARMGLNAGPVVFRDGDYFGRTVNVAARVTDYACPGEVLLTDSVATTISDGRVEFDPIGPIALKGLTESVSLSRAVRGSP
jgi:adenylate cyclase